MLRAQAPGNSRGFFNDSHYLGRFVFDLVFWFAIPVIFMNLVLGIIVDTFSELRTDKMERDLEYKSKCFICSRPDHDFEGHGGFAKHLREDHVRPFLLSCVILVAMPHVCCAARLSAPDVGAGESDRCRRPSMFARMRNRPSSARAAVCYT